MGKGFIIESLEEKEAKKKVDQDKKEELLWERKEKVKKLIRKLWTQIRTKKARFDENVTSNGVCFSLYDDPSDTKFFYADENFHEMLSLCLKRLDLNPGDFMQDIP